MTQLFTEDGARLAVTVIEAGPCPVVQVKSDGADGYDAVQLAFDEAKREAPQQAGDRTPGEGGLAPHRHLASSAAQTELAVGDTVTVESVRPRRPHQGHRHARRARASRAPSSATTSPAARVATARTTSGSPARSASPRGRPAVWKGIRMSGHMGAETVTQRGLSSSTRDPAGNLLLVSGSVPGAPGSLVTCGRTAMALQAPNVGGKGKVALQEAVFGVEATRVAPARDGARRAGRRAGRAPTRRRPAARSPAAARSRSARRAPAAPARARPAPRSSRGGGVVFGPQPRSYAVKVNRKAYLKARRMASRCTPPTARSACSTARSTRRARRNAHRADGQVARGSPARGRRRRHRGRRGVLVPQPAEDRRPDRRRARRRAILWARSLLVSEAALDAHSTGCSAMRAAVAVDGRRAGRRASRGRARRRGGRELRPRPRRAPATSSWRRSDREVRCADGGQPLHVPRRRGRPQDAGPTGRRGDLGRPRDGRPDHERAAEARPPRPRPGLRGPATRRRS